MSTVEKLIELWRWRWRGIGTQPVAVDLKGPVER